MPGFLHLFPTEGFGRVIVQGGFSFVFLYEIKPVGRTVLPHVRPAMGCGPDPLFVWHPKPEPVQFIGLSVCPAKSEVIDPTV